MFVMAAALAVVCCKRNLLHFGALICIMESFVPFEKHSKIAKLHSRLTMPMAITIDLCTVVLTLSSIVDFEIEVRLRFVICNKLTLKIGFVVPYCS